MTEHVDKGRRQLLTAATALTGAVGAAFAAAPFLASWKPSARAKALGAPVEIDISKLEPGQMIKVEWRGKPIWVLYRTKEMLADLQKHDSLLVDPLSKVATQQPAYAQNPDRSIKPDYLVLIGVCTHLGCSPLPRFTPGDSQLGANWPGGFYCPCHGSKFDLAGRVFKDVPAPTNLVVPPYRYLDDKHIMVGQDSTRAA
jgi:ubiquinol-cytochrome c reductase iron-sulfur subunit